MALGCAACHGAVNSAMPEIDHAQHPDARPHRYSQRARTGYKGFLDRWAAQRFFTRLIKRTNNFDQVTWLGHPVWQNVLDLMTIQQTICELKPDALIETGTNRGGSSLFFANLMDLMRAQEPSYDGRVLTIDIERLHSLSHPRVKYVLGSSVAPEILADVRGWIDECRQRAAGTPGRTHPFTTMVILDSDHSRAHVAQELEKYADFVTPGSLMLCQDGVLDTLPLLKSDREGPLPAIREFLAKRSDFRVDQERCDRFIVTHHPMGWLRRVIGNSTIY